MAEKTVRRPPIQHLFWREIQRLLGLNVRPKRSRMNSGLLARAMRGMAVPCTEMGKLRWGCRAVGGRHC